MASGGHSGEQQVGVASWKRGVPEVERGEREASLLEEERWYSGTVDLAKLETVAGGGQGDPRPEQVQLGLVHLAVREVDTADQGQEAAKAGHLGEAVVGQVDDLELVKGGETKEHSGPGSLLHLPEILEDDPPHIAKPPTPEERRWSCPSEVVA